MLKAVELTKAWGEHKAGETVEVDEERAAQLVSDGFGELLPEVQPERRIHVEKPPKAKSKRRAR